MSSPEIFPESTVDTASRARSRGPRTPGAAYGGWPPDLAPDYLNRSLSASLMLGWVKIMSRSRDALFPFFIARATVLITSLDSGAKSVQPRISSVLASITALSTPSVSPIVCMRGIDATGIELTRTSRPLRRASSSLIPMRESGGSVNTA